MNPDRAELGLERTSVFEPFRKNGYIPHWFREHALAARIFLAALAAPGAAVATDAIYHTEHPSIAYADSVPSGSLLRIEHVENCRWDVYSERKTECQI